MPTENTVTEGPRWTGWRQHFSGSPTFKEVAVAAHFALGSIPGISGVISYNLVTDLMLALLEMAFLEPRPRCRQ
jgi:hypothetical protein